MAKKKVVAKTTSARKKSTTVKTAERELIDTGKQKRYVRRSKDGQFKEVDDMGRSLALDRKKKAKTVVKAGQGDKGDQRKRKTK